MGKVIKKVPCPTCRSQGKDKSGNNLVIYEAQNGYCFKCKEFFPLETKDNFIVTAPPKKNRGFIYGDIIDIPDRGITKQTCKFYDYQVSNRNGVIRHIAPYYNLENELIKQKIRTVHNKSFFNTGEPTYQGLFGMNLWKPNKSVFITLTEGELDCLSIAQALLLRFPVLSLPDGWGSIEDALRINMDWLCGWKGVAFGLDNDDEGREAAKRGIDILSKTQVYIINWPSGIKDANQLITSSKDGWKKIERCVNQASPVTPDCIVNLGTIVKQALEPVKMGFTSGIPDLDEYCYGLRYHELILIGAGSSVGKTTFLNQIALHPACQHNEKVACITFEQDNRELVQKLVGTLIEKRISIPDTQYDYEHALRIGEQKLTNNIFSIDPSKGLNTVDKIINKIVYVITVMGVKWVFLDHLTYIAAMITGDERKGLDVVMAELARIVKEYECSIFAVSHLAKPSLYGKEGSNTQLTFEQGRQVLATDFRGSQALQYYARTIFALSRNIKEFDCLTKIELLKNRINSDHVGKIIELTFGRESGKLEQYNRNNEYKPLIHQPKIISRI